MRSDARFYATSRTYNAGGEDGTYGQFIPGLDPEDALLEGILLQVVNDPADTGFRANVGFVNPSLNTVTVTVTVYDADTGALIGQGDRSLPPRTFRQINNVFTFVGATNRVTHNTTVEVSATAPVLTYASVIDNSSDDPIFVLPFADEGTSKSGLADDVVRIFPGAASAAGVGDAFFVTDVRLFNPHPSESITVHLSFLDRDQDNSGAAEQPVTLPPRRGVAFDDVLSSFFGLANVVGGIRMRSDDAFYATSRTYNAGGESGTYGQFIPGLDPDDALAEGILLQVVNDPADTGFRANVGFVNPGLNTVTVTVTVYDADTGALIGQGNRSLPPRTFRQINNVFTFVGATNRVTHNTTVEFSATAPVLTYASVIDNTSDDPIFVLPSADQGTAR